MNVTINQEGNKYDVILEGRIDTTNATQFEQDMKPLMKAENADAETAVNEYYPSWNNPTGIHSTTAEQQVLATEYYNLQGMRISAPIRGTYIRIDRMADGTTRSHKVAEK